MTSVGMIGLENESVEKELLPSLNPLRMEVHPEDRSAEMAKKVSSAKLGKRPPEILPDEIRRLELARARNGRYKEKLKARKLAESNISLSRKVIFVRA